MASQRPSRPTCIRAAFSAAGFRKWQRHSRHRLQVSSRRNLMDFAEGIWREFLDPYDGDSEDTPGHSNYRSYRQCAYRLLGDRNRNSPSHTLRSRAAEEASTEDSPPKAPDLTMRASGWAPITLEVDDVDMQPEGNEAEHKSGAAEAWVSSPGSVLPMVAGQGSQVLIKTAPQGGARSWQGMSTSGCCWGHSRTAYGYLSVPQVALPGKTTGLVATVQYDPSDWRRGWGGWYSGSRSLVMGLG
ncbi:uncharacterized protein LOC116080812 isoform X1 [Mastomys coucha]|uniref:uncharacterized protein LOC116080812 isoform X1 n=1 Tax=Mastomys coucha TaxID=35658 RepID=UPI0012614CA4|nr:uncharacterized protein LOC116080812 isoform X1 [Mastomys coucha]